MGITGLLPLLKSIHKHCNLKKFAGQTIGVDAYGWLHRGTVACAIDLALEKPTTKYVDFAMHRVRMLIYFGVTPYIVFDGDNLPSKAGTEADRAKRREESKRRGLELYRAGKIPQAQQELQKAVDVTPYMARLLIEELKKMNVQYVVAPYEADAQLAYLERKGIINGILSEDSDLLVFGAKRLLTKLDQHGDCVEIDRADFASCREVSLIGWTDTDFRRMAILSGCDYLPNINKMGLKTAYRYVRKYKSPEKVLRMLQFEGQFAIPAGYLERYQQAELTFLHHRVFCPIAKKLVFLTELEPGTKEENLPYIGEDVDAEIAVGVACGDLHPTSKASIIVPAASASRSAKIPPRRQTLASATDLKPNKSLESFFQPKRQPLAELDPNSLTPSPSQQRLLHVHANASWEARTTSSAPQLRRSTSSIQNSDRQITHSSANTDRPAYLARAATMSIYQPPKRQRLCSDAEENILGADKSRFFDSKVEESSPSARRTGKLKRAKKSDFGIFSDDSVDGILLGLPDIEYDDPVKYPQLDSLEDEVQLDSCEAQPATSDHDSGYFDDTQAVPETSPMRPSRENSEDGFVGASIVTGSEEHSQVSSLERSLETTIPSNDEPGAFVDLLEYHVRKQNEALEKTFVALSPTRRANALRSLSQQSQEASLSDECKPLKNSKSRAISKQHFGTTIVPEDSNLDNGQGKLEKTFVYQPSLDQANALKSLFPSSTPNRNGQATAEQAALTGVSSPGSLKLPMTPLERLKRQALGKITPPRIKNARSRPSEDLIKPDSEDGSESDGEKQGTLQRHLDIAKFSFTPK